MMKGLVALSAAAAVQPAFANATKITAGDEDVDWNKVRAAYPSQAPYINLNNAAVSPSPLLVQDAVFAGYRFANTEPDVNMWDGLDEQRVQTKALLADLLGCSATEIAINRNSTEALCTAIFGIPLKPGDEVVVSDWDYPSVIRAWEQRASRDSVVVRRCSYDIDASDEAIVASYRACLSPRTRVVQLTHMIHWNGRVLPVRAICESCRHNETWTVVDAAQSFAHIPFRFDELGCDYLATSLHKWLCAPLGTGLLAMRRDRIEATWPLLAPFDKEPDGIEKFDHWNLGTYCSPLEAAIIPAIEFHNAIGTRRIHDRLRSLTQYWASRAADIPGFVLHTPVSAPSTGAVSLFSLREHDAPGLERALLKKHGIHVKARSFAGHTGVRVSPHIYTSSEELDRFVDALRSESRL